MSLCELVACAMLPPVTVHQWPHHYKAPPLAGEAVAAQAGMLLSAMPHSCVLPLTRPGCCAAGVVADKTRRDTVMRFSGLAMLGAPSLPASLTISKHRPPDVGRSLPGALC